MALLSKNGYLSSSTTWLNQIINKYEVKIQTVEREG